MTSKVAVAKAPGNGKIPCMLGIILDCMSQTLDPFCIVVCKCVPCSPDWY